MSPVIYLQIQSPHSRNVKAQRRARTVNVTPTAFALAPPLNGKVVDVPTEAVSANLHSPPLFPSFLERKYLPVGDRVVPVPVFAAVAVAVAVALLAAVVSFDVRK